MPALVDKLRGAPPAQDDRVLVLNELLAQNEWVPASDRARCYVCANKFSAFRRKYHCRRCGEVICHNCTMKRPAALPIVGICRVRLCKPCFLVAGQEHHELSQTRRSEATHTMTNSEDVFVSQQDMEDLEALISLNARELHTETQVFSGWENVNLQVPWLRLDELSDERQLSANEHAVVWLVKHRDSQLYVSKRLTKNKRTQQGATDFIDDIKLASSLQHQRIVKLVGVSWTRDKDLQALFEYMPGGDLRSYLDTTQIDGAMSPHRKIQKLRIGLDIAEALAYIHSLKQPLHHRVLESRNVLLSSDHRAKIGGFGKTRVETVMHTDAIKSDLGRWLAPEVISGNGTYDAACDIYSLGVMLCELDTHLIPFSDCRGPQGNVLPTVAVLFLISLGQAKPTMSADCPPELRQLADECLAFEPSERPSAIDVVARLRAFIRKLGLQNTLELSQSQEHQGVVLCDEDLLTSCRGFSW